MAEPATSQTFPLSDTSKAALSTEIPQNPALLWGAFGLLVVGTTVLWAGTRKRR